MQKAICHYSFHRLWKEQNWTADRLAEEVAGLGVECIDFHMGLMTGVPDAARRIREAVDKHGLKLSGVSCSNDFGQEDPDAFRETIEKVKGWLRLAGEVGAPVSRVFGGGIGFAHRSDPELVAGARERILNSVSEVLPTAEACGVVICIENHGGMPATGDEQVDFVKTIDSPFFRATIDVGNYMQAGNEGHVETAKAAPVAGYVHFKDFRKVPDDDKPWGWGVKSTIVGDGDVDLQACYDAMKDAGYDGVIALEYEGPEDEAVGVPRSVETMNRVMT